MQTELQVHFTVGCFTTLIKVDGLNLKALNKLAKMRLIAERWTSALATKFQWEKWDEWNDCRMATDA